MRSSRHLKPGVSINSSLSTIKQNKCQKKYSEYLFSNGCDTQGKLNFTPARRDSPWDTKSTLIPNFNFNLSTEYRLNKEKEDNNYYPIIEIFKKTNDKNTNINSIFNINSSEIISQLIKYMNLSCKNISFTNIKISNAKNIYYTLLNKNIICVNQIIDLRNKCKYLISDSGFIIPTKPSGTLYELPISNDFKKNIKPLNKTLDFLKEIAKYLNFKPYGFIYSDNKNNDYTIIAISIDQQISVPVETITISKNELKKLLPEYILESRSLYDIIDLEIE
jgi:hypothetical protein